MEEAPPGGRAAVVCTVRGAGDALHSWCAWHLRTGFVRCYVYLDSPRRDAATVAAAARAVRDYGAGAVEVVRTDSALQDAWRAAPSWARFAPHVRKEVQARQTLNADDALRRARAMGDVDWLLHCDADELFYAPEDHHLPAKVGAHFARLSSKGAAAFCYRNHEAVPEGEGAGEGDWFKSCTLFRRSPYELAPHARAPASQAACVTFWERRAAAAGGLATYFLGYSNGKSAVRVGAALGAESNHRWRSRGPYASNCAEGSDAPSEETACVLHYISCGFENWLHKYELLGRFPDAWFDYEVPIPTGSFHLNSRDVYLAGNREQARRFYDARVPLSDPAEVAAQLESGVCFRLHSVVEVLAAAVVPPDGADTGVPVRAPLDDIDDSDTDC